MPVELGPGATALLIVWSCGGGGGRGSHSRVTELAVALPLVPSPTGPAANLLLLPLLRSLAEFQLKRMT